MISRKTEQAGWIISAILLATAAVLLFLTAYQKQHWDSDIFWALKSGEWITANLSVPDTDPFSFTFEGRPWIDFTWGFQVLAHTFFTYLGGWAGLFMLQVMILGALYAALFANLRILSGRRLWLVASLLFLVLAGSQTRLFMRPHLPAYLLITVYLLLLTLYERSGRRSWLVALLPLQVAWVNLHSSFILGIFIVGAYAAGRVIDEFRSGGYRFRLDLSGGAKTLIAASIGVVVVSLVNPYGLELVVFPFVHQSADNADALRHIGEWQRLAIKDLLFNLYPVPVDQFAFRVLLLGSALSLVLNRRAVKARDVILLAGAFYMAASHIRFTSQLCYFAAPVLAANLSGWLEHRRSYSSAGAFWPVTLLALTAAALTVPNFTGHDAKRHRGLGVERGGSFPDVAVDFMEANYIRGPVFNEYVFGGYIIYRLYPEVRPFIDARTPTVYSPYFFWTSRLVEDRGHWEQVEEEYGLEAALIKPAAKHCSILWERDDWTPVIFDDASVLYLKDVERFRDVIDRHGLEHANPCVDPKKGYEPPEDPDELRAAREELKAFVDGPGAKAGRGWRMLGMVDTRLAEVDPGGDKETLLKEAVASLEKSVDLLDKPESIHALAVASARLGDPGRAARLFREAIARGSTNVKSYLGAGLALYDLGDYGKASCYLEKYARLADDEAEHIGYRVLGHACFKEGDLGCAEAYLKRASFTADDDALFAETEYYLGNLALEKGEFDTAERHYSRAVEAEPKYVGVLRDLAGEFESREEKEKARAVRRVVGP